MTKRKVQKSRASTVNRPLAVVAVPEAFNPIPVDVVQRCGTATAAWEGDTDYTNPAWIAAMRDIVAEHCGDYTIATAWHTGMALWREYSLHQEELPDGENHYREALLTVFNVMEDFMIEGFAASDRDAQARVEWLRETLATDAGAHEPEWYKSVLLNIAEDMRALRFKGAISDPKRGVLRFWHDEMRRRA